MVYLLLFILVVFIELPINILIHDVFIILILLVIAKYYDPNNYVNRYPFSYLMNFSW